MLRLFQHGCLIAEDAVRFDEVDGLKNLATVFALVASSPLGVAVGAFSFHETVGEEPFVILAVGQNHRFAVDVTVFLYFEIGFLDEVFVDWAFCPGVVVELYVEGFEELSDLLMVSVC